MNDDLSMDAMRDVIIPLYKEAKPSGPRGIKPCPKCKNPQVMMFYWKDNLMSCGRCEHEEVMSGVPAAFDIGKFLSEAKPCASAVNGTKDSVVFLTLPESVRLDKDHANRIAESVQESFKGTSLEGVKCLVFGSGAKITICQSEDEAAIERAKRLREGR
jgi:ribosomal protein S27AE